ASNARASPSRARATSCRSSLLLALRVAALAVDCWGIVLLGQDFGAICSLDACRQQEVTSPPSPCSTRDRAASDAHARNPPRNPVPAGLRYTLALVATLSRA